MRRITYFVLITIFILIFYFSFDNEKDFKVVKVNSSVEFFVDFNSNNVADENEMIQMQWLDNEPSCFNKVQNAQLNYLGMLFAKKTLLNKKVQIVRGKDKYPVVLLSDGIDYAQLLADKGYVLTTDNKNKVAENINKAKQLNIVSYNKKSNKFHNLDCKYALLSANEIVIEKQNLPKDAIPCKLCNLKNKKEDGKDNRTFYPKDIDEKYSPVYKDSLLDFYVTDFTKYNYPSSKCLTTLCKSLLHEINSAQSSIDFAIYGVDNQPSITNALINAAKRGVKIRWVYDLNKNGTTIYTETTSLKNILKESKSDIELNTSVISSSNVTKDAIMHNKFFIFDGKKVWTGSANISHTDLSGFNANSAVLIKSSQIAKIYTDEFEQMYSGYFHKLKNRNKSEQTGSSVAVYFSPQDRAISRHIIPLIKNAKHYVYVPVFVVTHKDFTNALIEAKQRGVDVRLIVDATSAGSKYSSVKNLRDNGVLVKTENRAGKMHMKSIIVDDKYVVLGSMNFTKSAENYNDENVLIISNPKLAANFKEKFLYFYNSIPNKWLYKNPMAESFNSINSCYDGVDNDFDGKVDMRDDSCKFKRY